MNKNKRSKSIFLLLMVLLFGIIFASTANATSDKLAGKEEVKEPGFVDDLQWDEWKEAHTVEVEVTTTYDYKKDGTLKITETYSGEKLKSKFKDDKLTKSQTFLIPDGEEVILGAESGSLKLKPGGKKEFVTRECIVLTTADDPYRGETSISSTVSSTSFAYPQWTFSKVTSLLKTYYKMEDPINLIWKQNKLITVKNVILGQKWIDNPVEYTHYLSYPDGSWVAGDGIADSKYRLSGGYHVRLWELPCGDVVSSAHHDDNALIIPGHQVDGYENAEAKIAGFFVTTHGSYWLNNAYYNSYYNAYNNGYATIV